METGALTDLVAKPSGITRQVAILVGGKGTRLGSLTVSDPKPLMPIDDSTVFLDEVIFNFVRQGFNDVLLLAGYMSDKVIARYEGKPFRGARVRVITESSPAGTAGALLNASDVLADTFALANGDSIFDFNFRALDIILRNNSKAKGVMALRGVSDASRYGRVDLSEGKVVGFHEKEVTPDTRAGLINAGVGIFRKEVIELISDLPCSIESDIYPKLAASGDLVGQEFSGYFIDIGLPETLSQARGELPARRLRPALFLDRDGVINHDEGYTHRSTDLSLVDGAVRLIRLANDLGALVIVVTNQAGVARGLYELIDVENFHQAMQDELAKQGAHIDDFYICPFHPEAKIERFKHECHPDRKPNPGMLLRAIKDWPIDTTRSMLIGDSLTDIEAASRVDIPAFLFESGNLYLFGHEKLVSLSGFETQEIGSKK